MDCHVCLGEGAHPTTVRFTNGDRSTLYLCAGCVERFRDDEFVDRIVPVGTP